MRTFECLASLLCVPALVSLSGVVLSPSIAGAQGAAKPMSRPPARNAAAESGAPAGQSFPVTRVSLYKNGVGFFEHAGRVTGDQAVTIDFTTAQLNDVLQSLTAIDLNGGRIAGAGYNSTTPLEQQLRSLPLALGDDPTALEFYSAIRGARVEVRAPGASITGRLLNLEVVNAPAKDGQPAAEKRMITVVSEAGEVRTLELTPATEVRLLDPALHTDVTRYLELLASTRNQSLRHLTLKDNGTGTRELRVSYISEVPIWKSTYRILFTDPAATAAAKTKQTATLQGWSVVDNTTGTDWVNVQLSLIAGSPQSFIQPLSTPYYARRPEIPLPQEAQLSPQTHESGEERKQGTIGMSGSGSAAGRGLGSGSGALSSGGLAQGVYGGAGQTNLNQNYVEGIPGGGANQSVTITAAAPSLDTANETLGGTISEELYQQLAAKSFRGTSTASSFDDFFEYKLTEPVTIRKNESAMVPILQTKLDAERVTLWSARQPQTPLRALWITNTSGLTLDRGSFSIVENGNFGGEGLLDPIHPAEKRLLSYAVDQAVRVTVDNSHNSSRVTQITAAKGVIELKDTEIAEVEYLVHNAAADARTVIVEQPIRPGYTLDSDPKPEETTASVYRFRVLTQPAETVRLHIGERRTGTSHYILTNSNDNQITFLLNRTGDNPALRQALAPVLEGRRAVADAQGGVDRVNQRLSSLRSDEERQRANVTALANADKAFRERFVHDLNATEDQIAAAQRELTAAQATLQAAKDALANRIEALQLDERL